MKILVASGIAAPEIGGPATFLAQMAPALRAGGHSVRVVAYGDTAPADDGVIRIPRGPLPLRLFRFWRSARTGTRWANVTLALSLGLPRPRRSRSPVAIRVPGDPAWERATNRGWIGPEVGLESFQSGDLGRRVAWLRSWRAREARCADLVIVPSAYLREIVLGWGVEPDRIQVIPSAVRPDPAARPLDRRGARRQLGWSEDTRYLVVAARLTPWKGTELVIEAAAGLENVRVAVIGDGPCRPALERAAEAHGGRVELLGAMPRHELALRLAAADYLVVYSAYEGLSHTILEAHQVGTPVIASRRGGNPEAVRHEVDGLLVAHPDREALAASLSYALRDDVRRRLAAGAAVAADRDERWSQAVAATTSALETLAREPDGGTKGVP